MTIKDDIFYVASSKDVLPKTPIMQIVFVPEPFINLMIPFLQRSSMWQLVKVNFGIRHFLVVPVPRAWNSPRAGLLGRSWLNCVILNETILIRIINEAIHLPLEYCTGSWNAVKAE